MTDEIPVYMRTYAINEKTGKRRKISPQYALKLMLLNNEIGKDEYDSIISGFKRIGGVKKEKKPKPSEDDIRIMFNKPVAKKPVKLKLECDKCYSLIYSERLEHHKKSRACYDRAILAQRLLNNKTD